MLDLSEKPDLIWLARLIADVQRAAPEADFMLAGAQARDVLLTHAYGIDTRRATEDVDLAFLVANWNEFDLLRARLIDSGRFIGTTTASYKLRHTGIGAARVDLIPFAGVEDAKRRMREYETLCLAPIPTYSSKRIRALRDRHKLSQAVLALMLNTSLSTVRQWEIGEKRPSGPSLKLLNLLDRKGLEALI